MIGGSQGPKRLVSKVKAQLRKIVTYIFGLGLALEVWLDGFVLLIELGQVRDKIFDDVGVGQRVDAGFVGGVWWDAACENSSQYQCRSLQWNMKSYTGKPMY